MRSTRFLGDVHASLMDMPFDGSRLFVDKAFSALQRINNSSATARSLVLSVAPCQPHSQFRYLRFFGRVFNIANSCHQLSSPLSLFVAAVPRDHVDKRGSVQPSQLSLQLPQPPSLFSVPLATHSHPVGGRIRHFLSGGRPSPRTSGCCSSSSWVTLYHFWKTRHCP